MFVVIRCRLNILVRYEDESLLGNVRGGDDGGAESRRVQCCWELGSYADISGDVMYSLVGSARGGAVAGIRSVEDRG